MLKLPKLTIFAFVACAIALAGAINYFQSVAPSRNLKSEDMSSTAEDLALQMVQIGGAATPRATQQAGACADCATALAGIANPMFQTEEFSKCDKVRQYLEADLDKLPAVFKGERTRSPGDFPRVCMTYIMRKNFEGVENSKTSALSVCKDPRGKPEHGNYPACVTDKYVNATYNYFTDVTSCLGIPQRDFLPKLFVESGLHVNSINSKPDGYDGGLAQLTEYPIADSKKEFPRIKKLVSESTEESCKRLAPYIKDLKPADSDKNYRCQLMTVPANPLLSLVTMASKIRQDTRAINSYMADGLKDDQKYSIISRLEARGLKPSDYDRDQLMQMMIALGYNSGASSAVIALSNYIDSAAATGRTLTKADFGISGESTIYTSVNSQTLTLTRQPKNDDARWAERVAKFKEKVATLETLNIPYKPTVVAVKVKGPILVGKSTKIATYDSYRLDIDKSKLSFSAYMQLYQTSGAAGYLSYVARKADELNSQFKAGTCVPESYLSL